MNLYYDGYTVADAVEFITRCYDKTPSNKMIETVKKELLEQANRVWN